MAAEHPTLQLPAIARLTNLENGLGVLVRINGRGTGNPRRLVEFTPRVALLLQIPDARPVKIRLTILGAESQDAIAGLPGAPTLAIATVPRGAIETTALAPPPGITAIAAAAPTIPAATTQQTGQALPTRLPETLTREPVYATDLMVRLGTFEQYQYAALQRARVAGLGPVITTLWQGRTQLFRVSIGPFATARDAEAAQIRAMASGVPDARIVAE
jgi:rare lipoprotein A